MLTSILLSTKQLLWALIVYNVIPGFNVATRSNLCMQCEHGPLIIYDITNNSLLHLYVLSINRSVIVPSTIDINGDEEQFKKSCKFTNNILA